MWHVGFCVLAPHGLLTMMCNNVSQSILSTSTGVPPENGRLVDVTLP